VSGSGERGDGEDPRPTVTEPGASAQEPPGLVDRRQVHSGRIVHLSVDTVRFPDGSTGEMELVRHRGASAVLPVDGPADAADPDILLLRQYRYATGGDIYEVPAGMRTGPEESWEACALRELEEETGKRAGRLVTLTWIYTTPGFTNEVIHLFLATELSDGVSARDADEFVEVIRLPLSTALGWIGTGRIVDAKSIVTLLFAARFVLRPGG